MAVTPGVTQLKGNKPFCVSQLAHTIRQQVFLALGSNTIANFNTGLGAGALLTNTADNNTAIGAGALLSNTDGDRNNAVGAFALFNNTTGGANNAIGYDALFQNQTGFQNNAHGDFALFSNFEGHFNTAMGGNALVNNTGGLKRRKQIFDRFAGQSHVSGVWANFDVRTPGNRARVADVNALEIPVIVPKFENTFASEVGEIYLAFSAVRILDPDAIIRKGLHCHWYGNVDVHRCRV